LQVILDIILPVFGVMLIGYGAARLGFFGKTASEGLSAFVFNFAIPVLLFRSLATTELPPVLPWGHLLSFYLGAAIVTVFGMAVGRIVRNRPLDGQGIVGLTAGYGNTVMIGVPLVLTAFGDAATLPLFLVIAFHSAVLITSGTIIVEIAQGSRAGLRKLPLNLFKAFATNPIIVGLMAGLVVAALSLPLPKPVDDITRLLGTAAAPCALFAMGAALPQYRIAGNVLESSLVTILKLAVHPLLVWLLATYVFTVDPLHLQVAVLLAATPVGANVYLLAARYDVGTATATTSVFLTTAASLFTLSIVLLLITTR